MVQRVPTQDETTDAAASTGASRLEEIATLLGHDAIRPIARGLMEELVAALAALDAGRHDTAHRVAGLAGTLGFTDVSAPWDALSRGEVGAAPAARCEADRAIVALAAWLGD